MSAFDRYSSVFNIEIEEVFSHLFQLFHCLYDVYFEIEKLKMSQWNIFVIKFMSILSRLWRLHSLFETTRQWFAR